MSNENPDNPDNLARGVEKITNIQKKGDKLSDRCTQIMGMIKLILGEDCNWIVMFETEDKLNVELLHSRPRSLKTTVYLLESMAEKIKAQDPGELR